MFKVLVDLLPFLHWPLLEHVLHKIISIPLPSYDSNILNLIENFAQRCLNNMSRGGGAQNIPKTISEWHCGLKLLWRAMQDERSDDEKLNPLATPNIQVGAMQKLVNCLTGEYGWSHQFSSFSLSRTLSPPSPFIIL